MTHKLHITALILLSIFTAGCATTESSSEFLAEDVRGTSLGGVQRFQSEHGGAFAKGEAVTLGIERAALRG